MVNKFRIQFTGAFPQHRVANMSIAWRLPNDIKRYSHSQLCLVLRLFRSYDRGKNLLHSKRRVFISIISLILIIKTNGTFSMPQLNSAAPKLVIDPTLDGRKEIANFNRLMDQIFVRMNLAIKAKNLDPMDLKIMSMLMANPPKVKVPRHERSYNDRGAPDLEWIENQARKGPHDVRKVKAWLHGMATMNRTSDVSIFFHETHRTIQCPFSLGPLELKVTKTTTSVLDKDEVVTVSEEDDLNEDENKSKVKSAKAITDLMLGLMDFKIDKKTGKVEITDVIFDEPGGVSVQGSLKRRANLKKNVLPYKLILASQTAMSLKDVAQLVVGLGSGIQKNKVTKDEMKNEGRFGTNPEWTNKIY